MNSYCNPRPLVSRARRAFTMLELVVTAVILAIVTAITVVSLQPVTSATEGHADGAALANILSVAQVYATRQGRALPTVADIAYVLANTPLPVSSPGLTSPISAVADNTPGTITPSSSPGQLSVNTTTTTVTANGLTVGVVGIGEMTAQGVCALAYMTTAKTVQFTQPLNPAQPDLCSGTTATAGPQ